MRLLEYKGKEILAKYGVKVPRGVVIGKPEDVDKANLNYPVFVKAQVPFAGRAKMGLVKRAGSKDEAKRIASEYLGRVIQDFEVKKVLLEEGVDVVKEYYVSVTIDRSSRTFILLASPEVRYHVLEGRQVLLAREYYPRLPLPSPPEPDQARPQHRFSSSR